MVESHQLNLAGLEAEGCTTAMILRGFDRLRRQVALRVAGQEGTFVGYDRVEMLFDTGVPSDLLCLVCCVLDRTSPHHHKVRYAAYAVIGESGDRHTDLLIAYAVGTTVVPRKS